MTIFCYDYTCRPSISRLPLIFPFSILVMPQIELNFSLTGGVVGEAPLV